MLNRAADIAASGRVAFLDATWSLQRHRDEAIAWAKRHDVPMWVVEVRASEETIRAQVLKDGQDDAENGAFVKLTKIRSKKNGFAGY